MNVIWKFPLELEGYQTVAMPEGSRLLHVAAQGDTPVLWALCNPKAPKVGRKIMLCVTGTSPEGPAGSRYVGTFLLGGGSFVGHIFDCGEEGAA